MNKLTPLIVLLWFSLLQAFDPYLEPDRLVISNKRIELPDYPDAYNPSLTTFENGYLLIFRYTPDFTHGRISYIGAVLLNEALQLISQPQLLSTRHLQSSTPSQSEDARVLWCRGDLYLVFNDNFDDLYPSVRERRDIYVAKLSYADKKFTLEQPLKLTHEQKYISQFCQKNWVPFVSEDKMLLAYQINPHEILEPDPSNGNCRPVYETKIPTLWQWGQLRGGTPALMVDGEYLAFFHSSCGVYSEGQSLLHYVMGAYTFNPNPPFEIRKMSPCPIQAKEFYAKTTHGKKVIFPGGFAVAGNRIHMAYGRNDCEIWIATLDKKLLQESLLPVGNYSMPNLFK